MLNESEADSTKNQVTWTSQAVGARYVLLPTRIPVQAELLLSISTIENTFGLSEDPSRSSNSQEINLSTNVTHYNRSADISWGLHFRFSELDSHLGDLSKMWLRT